MKSILPLIPCVFSMTLMACADQFVATALDYCANGDYQNCKISRDAGECIKEAGCDNPVNNEDIYLGAFTGNMALEDVNFSDGYVGKIDTGCRTLNKKSYGGDADWIAVKAKPGIALKVEVHRPPLHLTKPVIYLHNRAGGELIYSTPDDYGNATLTFLAPEELFYVSVEERENYAYSYQNSCDDANLKGGDEYFYLLKITNAELAFTELGLIKTDASHKAKMNEPGMAQYIRFSMPRSMKPKVVLKTTSHDVMDAVPVLSPLSKNTSYGESSEFAWIYAGDAFKSRTSYEDYYSIFRDEIDVRYGECDDINCTYAVAVTDYSSVFGYEYELTVTAVSQ